MDTEDMRWKLFKVYPGGDWLADVTGWDPQTVKRKFRYYRSLNKIK